MDRTIRIASALILLLAGTGCASSSTVREARSQPKLGTSVTFDRPCADHWTPILDTGRRLRWKIEEEDPDRRFLVASTPARGWTWGEHIAVALRDDGAQCSVRVYSRRSFPLNVTATDWENDFFERYLAR